MGTAARGIVSNSYNRRRKNFYSSICIINYSAETALGLTFVYSNPPQFVRVNGPNLFLVRDFYIVAIFYQFQNLVRTKHSGENLFFFSAFSKGKHCNDEFFYSKSFLENVCVCVFFFCGRLGENLFMHTTMLCRTRPFLVIPTKTSLLVLCRVSPDCNSPAGSSVRHYFAEGNCSRYGPPHRLALGRTASSSLFPSSFFFSSNAI